MENENYILYPQLHLTFAQAVDTARKSTASTGYSTTIILTSSGWVVCNLLPMNASEFFYTNAKHGKLEYVTIDSCYIHNSPIIEWLTLDRFNEHIKWLSENE